MSKKAKSSINGLWTKWTDSNVESFFSFRPHIGNGEKKLACDGEFSGSIVQGPYESFDLLTPTGQKWEVKEIKKELDEIRVSVNGSESALKFWSAASRFVVDLESWRSSLTDNELYDFAGQISKLKINDPKFSIDVIESFIEEHVDNIMRGELSLGSIIGSKMTTSSMKAVAESLRFFYDLNKSLVRNLPLAEGFNVCDALVLDRTYQGFSSRYDMVKILPTSRLEKCMSYLTHEYIGDPSLVERDWNSIANVKEVFSRVDGLALVNEKLGYAKVKTEDLGKVLRFSRISQMDLRFRIKKDGDP